MHPTPPLSGSGHSIPARSSTATHGARCLGIELLAPATLLLSLLLLRLLPWHHVATVLLLPLLRLSHSLRLLLLLPLPLLWLMLHHRVGLIPTWPAQEPIRLLLLLLLLLLLSAHAAPLLHRAIALESRWEGHVTRRPTEWAVFKLRGPPLLLLLLLLATATSLPLLRAIGRRCYGPVRILSSRLTLAGRRPSPALAFEQNLPDPLANDRVIRIPTGILESFPKLLHALSALLLLYINLRWRPVRLLLCLILRQCHRSVRRPGHKAQTCCQTQSGHDERFCVPSPFHFSAPYHHLSVWLKHHHNSTYLIVGLSPACLTTRGRVAGHPIVPAIVCSTHTNTLYCMLETIWGHRIREIDCPLLLSAK
ncbi:MAG: hypothetical protein D8M59_10150 [Planctomycetes bacterium]|nr:hypothetical protein [Planctomycetota bacterium]